MKQHHAPLPDAADAADWFAGRLPEEWFDGDPQVTVDREEITVIGRLPAVSDEPKARVAGRVSRFREDTRTERMHIADEAQAKYRRKVSWGVDAGADDDLQRVLFTHLSVPVMTRLRQPERQVLDTLVDAGVARSRSDALGWSVKLVGQHAEQWLTDLRSAMSAVDELRAQGPDL
ncbi:MAG TPA: hypothetical protein VFW21_11750 [Mycobacterium sp.]|nr:hypothetical protein [Mycobacterium sp.]